MPKKKLLKKGLFSFETRFMAVFDTFQNSSFSKIGYGGRINASKVA